MPALWMATVAYLNGKYWREAAPVRVTGNEPGIAAKRAVLATRRGGERLTEVVIKLRRLPPAPLAPPEVVAREEA
jgi:hypothetical protein